MMVNEAVAAACRCRLLQLGTESKREEGENIRRLDFDVFLAIFIHCKEESTYSFIADLAGSLVYFRVDSAIVE